MGCASETRRATQNRRARADEDPRKCRPSYEWQHYLTADEAWAGLNTGLQPSPSECE